MNGFDVLLVLVAGFAAFGGWKLGFLRRLSGWVGAGLGVALAIVILPSVMDRLGTVSDVTIFAVGAALLVLLASIGQGLGAVVGSRLRLGVDSRAGEGIDAFGGAVLGIAGVIVLVWLVLPVMAESEGWPSATARGSSIARVITEHLPDPPRQITDLERELAGGEFPEVFAGLRTAPDLPAPPQGSPIDAGQLQALAPSVAKLQSNACGRIQSGSGFFVAERVLATNAHVVAGASGITVIGTDGRESRGEVIAIDPRVDLALVATDASGPVLPLADPGVGDVGLVMGFPGGGPFDPSPFEVGERLDATGYDIYDDALVERDLLVLASDLAPGDSGSAVLRADGAVVGVAVAIAPDRSGVAYALASSELAELLRRGASGPVPTGACVR